MVRVENVEILKCFCGTSDPQTLDLIETLLVIEIIPSVRFLKYHGSQDGVGARPNFFCDF